MYLPAIWHNKCLAVIFCGLITISQAQVNNVPPPPQSYHPQHHPNYHPSNPAYAHPNAKMPSGLSAKPALQPHHHSSSYAMLRHAMSEAVSHEFSKCIFDQFIVQLYLIMRVMCVRCCFSSFVVECLVFLHIFVWIVLRCSGCVCQSSSSFIGQQRI